MKSFRWLACALLFTFSSMPQAAELSVFNNQYTAKLYGFSVTATSKLTAKPNGNYEFLFKADAMVGSVTETSEFAWNAKEQQVIPLLYSYNRTGLGKNADYQLAFDWVHNTVTNTSNNNSLPLNAAQKVHENLSYQVQLRQDLIDGKKNFSYPITNGKKIRDYRFEIAGEEILDTPMGKVNTVKIKRLTKGDRETYAWFAKDFQYLLVRLQQEENGSAYTIYISKASLNGKAIDHF